MVLCIRIFVVLLPSLDTKTLWRAALHRKAFGMRQLNLLTVVSISNSATEVLKLVNPLVDSASHLKTHCELVSFTVSCGGIQFLFD